jgi:hypothetical protein
VLYDRLRFPVICQVYGCDSFRDTHEGLCAARAHTRHKSLGCCLVLLPWLGRLCCTMDRCSWMAWKVCVPNDMCVGVAWDGRVGGFGAVAASSGPAWFLVCFGLLFFCWAVFKLHWLLPCALPPLDLALKPCSPHPSSTTIQCIYSVRVLPLPFHVAP